MTGIELSTSTLRTRTRVRGTDGRWLSRLRAIAVNALLALAAALFGVLAVGPHLLGYRTETMLTASMAPVINPGDVVVVTREPSSQARPGQILTFQPPLADGSVVTHRVMAVTRRADGSIVLQTKGDANPGPDPWRAVIADDHVWRVRAVLPHLGDAIRLLRSGPVRPILVWVLPGTMAIWLLVRLWQPRRRERR